MKNILIIGLVALTILSCKQDNVELDKEVETKTVDNKVSENVLYTGTSVYGNFFAHNAPIVGYSSLKQDALSGEELAILSPRTPQLKSVGMNDLQISINGVGLDQSQLQLKSGILKEQNKMLDMWYGQDVEFIVTTSSLLKSGDMLEEKDTVRMYMPDLVHIISPEIQTEEELYPLCYYKNFELHWNADEKNENGVVVIVEWLGSIVGENKNGNYVRNIDILPDNGKAILNNKIFDGIPDKAYAYLTILRGNIDLIDINEMSYRVLGNTQEVLPLVLIRNIE